MGNLSIRCGMRNTGSRSCTCPQRSSASMSFSWLFLGGLVSTRTRFRFTNRGQHAVNSVCRSSILQRTANYLLTVCLTPGGKPIVLKKVLPRPPWSGEPAHEKGVVAIAVLVDYDGTLKSTSSISGDPVLADVAAHAIHQWQFKPFVLNGEPVQVESRIVMKFSKKRADVVPGDR